MTLRKRDAIEGDNGQRRDHRMALVQLSNVEDAVMALIVSNAASRARQKAPCSSLARGLGGIAAASPVAPLELVPCYSFGCDFVCITLLAVLGFIFHHHRLSCGVCFHQAED